MFIATFNKVISWRSVLGRGGGRSTWSKTTDMSQATVKVVTMYTIW